MINFMALGLLDYKPKTLQVAIKPLENVVADGVDKIQYNCLIFNPGFDKTNGAAMGIYERFFENNPKVQLVLIETEQGPGELAQVFQKQYKAKTTMWVGGMVAPIHIPEKQVTQLVEDLNKDPKKYFVSEEKKRFG
jgi:hypothetical protein